MFAYGYFDLQLYETARHGFIQLQVKVTICKHIIQIIKKIAKLNIGYCSTKFRIESQVPNSTAEY